jgi:hypothetical protein
MQKRPAAAGGDELRHTVVAGVAAVVVGVPGQHQRNFQSLVLVERDPTHVIDDGK